MPAIPRVAIGQRLDRVGCRLRRGRHGDRPRVGDVVEQPDGDAALHGRDERREHECAGVRLEANVIEGEVERLAGLRQEARDAAGHVRGPLPSVHERLDLDGSGRGRHVHRLRVPALPNRALTL